MNFNKDYILQVAMDLLQIDSPSGFTLEAMKYVSTQLDSLGYTYSFNNKGGMIIPLTGKDTSYTIGVTAHVDTLGLMIRSIKKDGTLLLTAVGGPIVPTLDGEYCRIYTRDNRVYTGTILSDVPAAHVYADASSKVRNIDTICIRLDEVVHSKEDVIALGIDSGDYVAIDPKATLTNSGFIKSRFLDDKICVASIMGLLKSLKEENVQLPCNVTLLLSNYEEVGHGLACIPQSIQEFIALDMGCIGKDLGGNEYTVSICAKDSSGPYDYEMTSKLIALAKKNNLKYAVDIFPYYGSDVSAALRAGNDIKGALIGPGVHASHGMERTHYEGVEQSIILLSEYLINFTK